MRPTLRGATWSPRLHGLFRWKQTSGPSSGRRLAVDSVTVELLLEARPVPIAALQ